MKWDKAREKTEVVTSTISDKDGRGDEIVFFASTQSADINRSEAVATGLRRVTGVCTRKPSLSSNMTALTLAE